MVAGLAIAAGVALASAIGATWLVRAYAQRRLVAVPSERSSHQQPTPSGGGIAISIAALLAGLMAVVVDGPELPANAWILLPAGAGVSILGFWDDHVDLAARKRLMLQFAIVAALVFALPPPTAIRLAGTEVELPWAVTWTLWLLAGVGVVNLTNFMDGLDGMVGTQAVVIGVAYVVLAFAIGLEPGTKLLSVVGTGVAISALGFLVFNWPPASIFMGDAGSTFLGLCFFVMALLVARAGYGLDVAVLPLLGILADSTFTLLRRIKRGETPSVPHRSHLYQRLCDHWGGGHRRITVLYGLMGLGGSVLAFFTLRSQLPAGVGLLAWAGLFAALSAYGRRVKRP